MNISFHWICKSKDLKSKFYKKKKKVIERLDLNLNNISISYNYLQFKFVYMLQKFIKLKILLKYIYIEYTYMERIYHDPRPIQDNIHICIVISVPSVDNFRSKLIQKIFSRSLSILRSPPVSAE